MSSIPVTVKHGAKKHNVDLDPSSTGETFKFQMFSLTGVEPERQKILIAGKQLQDDAVLSTLKIKPKSTLMMMGTPSGNSTDIVKPKEAVKFIEDMTEAEAAQSEGAIPAGLTNLGNTCYMNSTLQTLKAMPELQEELSKYAQSSTAGAGTGSSSGLGDFSQFGITALAGAGDLTGALRDLYKEMSETQEGLAPYMVHQRLMQAYPQFAEKARDGRGLAQQDAEEAWSQLVALLKNNLKGPAAQDKSFIDTYMGGTFTHEETCLDPDAAKSEGPAKKPEETFYKLPCHVASKDVSHLREGISAALTSTYSKTSPTLGREAEYSDRAEIARLPKYLPVHFVRFFWKRDVNKKAKILRKVTFPHELDAVEFCTDALRARLVPVRDRIRELRKEEEDSERARKRQRRMRDANPDPVPGTSSSSSTTTTTTKSTAKEKEKSKDAEGDTEMEFKTDAQLESERAASILTAKRALLKAADEAGLGADRGANQTGLYELIGVITHQGASADSGHYTAYVRREIRRDAAGKPRDGEPAEGAEKWWWFNDERVSLVEHDKIETLAGGGESHSALILLYKAVELPVLTEEEKKVAA